MQKKIKMLRGLVSAALVLVLAACSSMKQLWDLRGIIVSSNDQIFTGRSTIVPMDITTGDLRFSFNATSDPIDNGYPITIRVDDSTVASVTQSASDPSRYTITGLRSGYTAVTAYCSSAYYFTFIVYVADTSRGISIEYLKRQRDDDIERARAEEQARREAEAFARQQAREEAARQAELRRAQQAEENARRAAEAAERARIEAENRRTQELLDAARRAEQAAAEARRAQEAAEEARRKQAEEAANRAAEEARRAAEEAARRAQEAAAQAAANQSSSGQASSNETYLNASTKVSINATRTTVYENTKITFTSSVTPEATEGIRYKWYLNGNPAANGNGSYLVWTPTNKGTAVVDLEVTGIKSGYKVFSNKLTIKINERDLLAGNIGFWQGEGNNSNLGVYISSDGKLYTAKYVTEANGKKHWVRSEDYSQTVNSSLEFKPRTSESANGKYIYQNGKIYAAGNLDNAPANTKCVYSKKSGSIIPDVPMLVSKLPSVTLKLSPSTLSTKDEGLVSTNISYLNEDVTYKWYVNGVRVANASGSTYRSKFNTGKNTVYVEITGSKSGATKRSETLSFNVNENIDNIYGLYRNGNSNNGLYVAADKKVYYAYIKEGSSSWYYINEPVGYLNGNGTFTTSGGSLEYVASASRIQGTFQNLSGNKTQVSATKIAGTPMAANAVNSSKKPVVEVPTSVKDNADAKFIVRNFSADEPVTYTWKFSNGKTATTSVGECTQRFAAGSYSVTVTAKGSVSGKSSLSEPKAFTVSSSAPAPTPTPTPTPTPSQDVSITSSGVWVCSSKTSYGYYFDGKGAIYQAYEVKKGGKSEFVYIPVQLGSVGSNYINVPSPYKMSYADGKINASGKIAGVECSGTFTKQNKSIRKAKLVDGNAWSSYKINLNAQHGNIGNGFIGDVTLPDLDEDVTYEWYVNGSKASTDSSLKGKILKEGDNAVYCRITGKISGVSVVTQTVTIKGNK